MKPIALKLEAFGPFVETQTIEFEAFSAHGLFLIHGATGSGKSTLLDALTYALFDSKSVERGGADFVSTLDPGATTRVTFEFEHGGRAYRIMRQPAQWRRSKRGDADELVQVQSEAELQDLTDRRVLATKTSDTTREVERLLNMTVEQFRQTVVLPQGEFRSVITDHKTRREVLARVFRTSRFARLTDRIRRRADALDAQAGQLQERRRAILADTGVNSTTVLAATLATAAAARDEAARERARRDEVRILAAARVEAAGRLAASFAELDGLRATLADLEAQRSAIDLERTRCERGTRAARVLDLRDAYASARVEATATRTATHGAGAAVDSAVEALQKAAVALDREQAREGERALALERERSLRALAGPLADLREARAEADAKAEALTRAELDLAAATTAVAEHQQRRHALSEVRVGLRRVVATDREVREGARVLEAHVVALRQVEEQERIASAARHSLANANGGEDAAARWLLDLRDHAAGLLASDLRPGEACPVCGSTDHPALGQPADVGAVTALLDTYREESALIATLRAAIDLAERRRREILAERGWASDEVPDAADVRERAAAAAASLEEVEAARRQLERIDAECDALDVRGPELEVRHRELVREHGSLDGEVRGLRARAAALEERVDPALRDPGAFETELAAAEAATARLTRSLAEAERAHLRATSDVERARGEHILRSERAQAAESAAEAAEGAFFERLREQGFDTPDALAAAEVPTEDLERTTARLAQFDAERSGAMGSLRVVAAQLEGKERPDLDALHSRAGDAEAAWTEADEGLTRANEALHRLVAADRELRDVQERYDALGDRLEATARLAELASGRVRGRAKIDFETFVIESIVAEVLSIGNAHLHGMTDGRYTLHLVDRDEEAGRRGLELEVSDNFSGGGRRPVKTLSGGEGFLASLALALGLSESAERTSGASELGALFIDEGFGSLDAAALDTVVGVLRTLPNDGRVVGVITHVDEMKRRIPAQLLVERHAVGSRVTRCLDG
ncbi:MAG: SMC family ATPase [Trueperaceae bacterium]|nr:SMC family ATPase [Trueperaceae bacterium]